jgi:DNA-binding transcriptional ArsR family regulator
MVVEMADEQIDQVFHALADATRRDIVVRTFSGPHSVSQLAASYAMSFAAVQKHVAVLERAGLVSKQRHGREQLVRARIDAVQEAQRLLAHFEDLWRARLTTFGDALAESHEGAQHERH